MLCGIHLRHPQTRPCGSVSSSAKCEHLNELLSLSPHFSAQCVPLSFIFLSSPLLELLAFAPLWLTAPPPALVTVASGFLLIHIVCPCSTLITSVFLFFSTKAERKWPAGNRLRSHTHTHILSYFLLLLLLFASCPAEHVVHFGSIQLQIWIRAEKWQIMAKRNLSQSLSAD